MPVLALSKRNIDALAAPEKEQLYWDPALKGFGLKVQPSGLMSYVVQYRIGGRGAKTRRYTIGVHGSPWTPSAARTEAEKLLIKVRQGADVLRERKEREQQARDLAFNAYVDHFVDGYLKEHWPASWTDAKNTLVSYASPALRDKPLPTITRQDVRAVLERANRSVSTRRKLFAILRKLFRWAVNVGDLAQSPIDGMEAPLAPTKRDRVLSDVELRLVLAAIAGLGKPFAPLIRLLVLTGQRVDEWARADWKEFDRSHREWVIPKERAKNGQATIVPLTPSVLDILDALAGSQTWPRMGYLFTTTGKTPVSGFSRAKARLDKAIAKIDPEHPFEDWRFHDLRRTLATGLQRLGIRFEVTEALLNHISGARSGVAGVYQRHDWREEKRSALEGWDRHVKALSSGADKTNVVELRRA